MGKKINELTPLTNSQVDNNARLLPIADPTSGVAGYGSIAQLKLATSTQRYKHIATGAEGVTITISALANKVIEGIWREGMCLYDVVSAPDSVEYIWDGIDVTLGLATGAGERFLILYKNA